MKLFETICKGADRIDLEYEKVPEDNLIAFGVMGDDLPMSIIVDVDEGNDTIIFAAKLMFEVPADQALKAANALNGINTNPKFGQFHYDEGESAMFFRFGLPLMECKATPEFIANQIMMVAKTVDANDGNIK